MKWPPGAVSTIHWLVYQRYLVEIVAVSECRLMSIRSRGAALDYQDWQMSAWRFFGCRFAIYHTLDYGAVRGVLAAEFLE